MTNEDRLETLSRPCLNLNRMGMGNVGNSYMLLMNQSTSIKFGNAPNSSEEK